MNHELMSKIESAIEEYISEKMDDKFSEIRKYMEAAQSALSDLENELDSPF